MGKLYEISSEYSQLLSSDLDPEMIADTIEAMEGEFSDKVEQLLSICKNESAYAGTLKEESKKLAERAKAQENKVISIKLYIIKCMADINKKSMVAGLHKITVRKPSSSVNITNKADIPPEYCEFETSVKIDKTQIKAVLKSGDKIPGAELLLGKPSLTIK